MRHLERICLLGLLLLVLAIAPPVNEAVPVRETRRVIRGRVLNQSGAPVVRATVTAQYWRRGTEREILEATTETGPDGQFEVSVESGHEVELLVRAHGDECSLALVSVAPSQNDEITVRLKAACGGDSGADLDLTDSDRREFLLAVIADAMPRSRAKILCAEGTDIDAIKHRIPPTVEVVSHEELKTRSRVREAVSYVTLGPIIVHGSCVVCSYSRTSTRGSNWTSVTYESRKIDGRWVLTGMCTVH